MRITRLLTVLVLLSLAGCGRSWRPLDTSALRRKQPRTLVLVLEPSATFYIEGPWWFRLAGPLSTAVAQVREGDRIRRKYGLVDPAAKVGDTLATALTAAYRLDRVVVTADAVDEAAQAAVRAAGRSAADLVLAVKTTSWWVGPAPGHTDRYAVFYAIETSLTDTRGGQVLALGACEGTDPTVVKARKAGDRFVAARLTQRAPLDTELLANGGELLKGHLAAAADRCARAYHEKLFFVPR